MSIGLYDEDFFKYKEVMLNLDVMKMASYYKKHKEVTLMAPTFDPERYTKFITRKDFYDGEFLEGLHKYDNVEYGGLAYTGGVYVPMDKEIELCKPDRTVYARFEHTLSGVIKQSQISFKTLLRASHVRLSLDGKNLWPDFEKAVDPAEKKTLYLHDVSVGAIKNAPAAVEYLIKNYFHKNLKPYVGFKFPLEVKNYDDLKLWDNQNFTALFSDIKLNFLYDDEQFCELLYNGQRLKLNRIMYRLGDEKTTQAELIETILPQAYLQGLLCRDRNIRLTLYIENDYLICKEIKTIIKLINQFLNISLVLTPALFYICQALWPENSKEYNYRKNAKIVSLEEARAAFLYFREKNPELFRMFYECNKAKLEGGRLVSVNGSFGNQTEN